MSSLRRFPSRPGRFLFAVILGFLVLPTAHLAAETASPSKCDGPAPIDFVSRVLGLSEDQVRIWA